MDREVPSVDLDLLETGTLDSMSLVELLLHLEQEFGVVIDLGDVDLEQLRTVTGITQLVQGFLNSQSSSGSRGTIPLDLPRHTPTVAAV
jgi:acyl carrier protein